MIPLHIFFSKILFILYCLFLLYIFFFLIYNWIPFSRMSNWFVSFLNSLNPDSRQASAFVNFLYVVAPGLRPDIESSLSYVSVASHHSVAEISQPSFSGENELLLATSSSSVEMRSIPLSTDFLSATSSRFYKPSSLLKHEMEYIDFICSRISDPSRKLALYQAFIYRFRKCCPICYKCHQSRLAACSCGLSFCLAYKDATVTYACPNAPDAGALSVHFHDAVAAVENWYDELRSYCSTTDYGELGLFCSSDGRVPFLRQFLLSDTRLGYNKTLFQLVYFDTVPVKSRWFYHLLFESVPVLSKLWLYVLFFLLFFVLEVFLVYSVSRMVVSASAETIFISIDFCYVTISSLLFSWFIVLDRRYWYWTPKMWFWYSVAIGLNLFYGILAFILLKPYLALLIYLVLSVPAIQAMELSSVTVSVSFLSFTFKQSDDFNFIELAALCFVGLFVYLVQLFGLLEIVDRLRKRK